MWTWVYTGGQCSCSLLICGFGVRVQGGSPFIFNHLQIYDESAENIVSLLCHHAAGIREPDRGQGDAQHRMLAEPPRVGL